MIPNEKTDSSDGERRLFEIVIDYLAIVLRYKWMIFIITGLSAITAVAFSILSLVLPPEKSPLPNKYRAEAVLIVQELEGGGLNSVIAALGIPSPEQLGGNSGKMDYGQLALMVLESRTLIDTIIEEFNIKQRYNLEESTRTQAREAVLGRADFKYTRSGDLTSSSGILNIRFEAIDPVFARDIVNRMVELLNEWFLSKGGSTKLKKKELLENKIAEMSTEIARLETDIENFQRKYGVLTVEELANSQSQVLADLRSQLIIKEMEIKNYARFSKIEDPELTRLRAERDNIEELISLNEREFTGLDLPSLSLEFARLKMALDIQTRIFESLSEQYEIAKLTLGSEPVFQILELAEVPDEKSSPSRGKICMIVTVFALIISMLIAFLMNAIHRMRNDPSRIKRIG